MYRINSSNIRPDLHGLGKPGFHDNTDIPGQDATYLTPDWLNIIQEEICNVIELNGHTLDQDSKHQLFDILATNADLFALSSAMEDRLQQVEQDSSNADSALNTAIGNIANNLQQQISATNEALQLQISNLVNQLAAQYPKTLMAGVLTSTTDIKLHTIDKPNGSSINFLDRRYSILVTHEARVIQDFYIDRKENSFDIYLNVDDLKSSNLNSKNINYAVIETTAPATSSGDGEYFYIGSQIAIPILPGQSKSFLIIGGGGGSSRAVNLSEGTPQILKGANGQDSYIRIGEAYIYTSGGGKGGASGVRDDVTNQSIPGSGGSGGQFQVTGEPVSSTRANGAAGNATLADHTGGATDQEQRGAGGNGANGFNSINEGFGSGGGEGARLSIVHTNTTSSTQYATIYVGSGGEGERSLNTYNSNGELITAAQNYEVGQDGKHGFIRVSSSL